MKRFMPTTYFLFALIAVVVTHLFIPSKRLIVFPLTLTGVLPVVTGVWLNLSADKSMKRYETTVKPFESTNALIVDGVFGMTRNPMYLGMILILMGVVILLGSLAPWLCIAVFTVVLQVFFILPEEHKLETAFGPLFTEYKNRVHRWI